MYFYGDGFDCYAMAPINLVPIVLDRPFRSFERLRQGWNRLAERVMTVAIVEHSASTSAKGPAVDIVFEVDGVRFVKPSPQMGQASAFFVDGRPRSDSRAAATERPVATTYPLLDRATWEHLREAVPGDVLLIESFEGFRKQQRGAEGRDTPLKPFVLVPVIVEDWSEWCRTDGGRHHLWSVGAFANKLFNEACLEAMRSAREYSEDGVLPSRYVLLHVEETGRDKANDLSSIAFVREQPFGETVRRPVVTHARMPFERGLALSSAHATKHGIDSVLYVRDQRHGWA